MPSHVDHVLPSLHYHKSDRTVVGLPPASFQPPSMSDEELKRAIALSLQEAARAKASPILMSDDEYEEEADDDAEFQRELQRAIEASKAEGSSLTAQGDSSKSTQPRAQEVEPATSTFLSERVLMEKERLERQKCLRSDTSFDDNGKVATSKRPHLSETCTNGKSKVSAAAPGSFDGPSTSQTPMINPVFWEGEVHQVVNRHAEPWQDGRPTFRLTEVLGKKSDISFTILSSYSLALSWIYEFFDRDTPVIMVAHDATRLEAMHNVFPNWVRTVPKLHNGRGCMHMKIFYKTGHLHVVISTANLIDIDWRDIENTVWLQDLPLRPSPIPHDPKVLDDFPVMMQHVLQMTNVRPALAALQSKRRDVPIKAIEDLHTRWDWSKVKVELVPSIAGRHEGWPRVPLTGHCRLMRAVQNMGMRTRKGKGKNVSLEYQIIFPSLKMVRATVLGKPGRGTMFCSPNQWRATKFPRDKFYDSKSKAGGMLMHSKGKGKKADYDSDTDTDTDMEDDDVIELKDEKVGWAYIGSHNFTPSAWGNLLGSSFNPVLNVTNYELGVMFPLKDDNHVDRTACWERPPKKYVLGDDVPWMQDDSKILQQLRAEL
ncbi:hypothetical protein PILCRDRAFT_786360 [Piloderma croceum F 1598]|uniref:PLD phosphodiesterase domain-containing protein n=1 Tax=Piloderma croceum (strain F 1598) TaxID=765440 RepID=A0A0C3FBJ8_PILCF|nr:hypothetical protein PILCRDRAFT_786360 [Piloderma croceum F 1598]